MLLGFKRRFAPLILDGSKSHTIRALREDGKLPKIGETLHCYVDPRQKTMALLGRWPCVHLEEILIYTRSAGTFGVLIDNEDLTLDEKNRLAYQDGFRSTDPFLEMMRFWMSAHGHGKVIGICVTKKCRPLEPRLVGGNGVDFKGVVIHWKFADATRSPKWRDVLKRIEEAA